MRTRRFLSTASVVLLLPLHGASMDAPTESRGRAADLNYPFGLGDRNAATCSSDAAITKSNQTRSGACKYYAYVVYGEAKLANNIKQSERIYREISVFRSAEGFRACCNDYCSYSCAGFSVANIGPYDNEMVAYLELQKQVNQLQAQGYKPYERFKHMIIGILQFGYQAC